VSALLHCWGKRFSPAKRFSPPVQGAVFATTFFRFFVVGGRPPPNFSSSRRLSRDVGETRANFRTAPPRDQHCVTFFVPLLLAPNSGFCARVHGWFFQATAETVVSRGLGQSIPRPPPPFFCSVYRAHSSSSLFPFSPPQRPPDNVGDAPWSRQS